MDMDFGGMDMGQVHVGVGAMPMGMFGVSFQSFRTRSISEFSTIYRFLVVWVSEKRALNV